jgi:hypothetical protein
MSYTLNGEIFKQMNEFDDKSTQDKSPISTKNTNSRVNRK